MRVRRRADKSPRRLRALDDPHNTNIARGRETDKTPPEECAGLRSPGGRVRVNMLEIASAVLFENFNCIVELSHECFSLPENDT